MRNTKMLLILLVVSGILVWTCSPALAGRGCGNVNGGMGTYEYPQAPGKKINASLAIYYGPSDVDLNMYVMVKARRAGDACAFSGIIPTSDYNATKEQFANIGLFFEDTVLPQILGCTGDQCPQFCQPSSSEDCSDLPSYFSLKSTDDIFEDDWGQCGFNSVDFNFMFVDVVIAIVD